MKNPRRSDFTLIELMAATFVLAMVVLGLLQVFSVTQKLMTHSSSKIEMCSRARMALDMISADVECLCYKEDVATLAISTEKGLSIATQRTMPVPKIVGGKISSDLCASRKTAVNYNVFKLNADVPNYYVLRSIAVGSDDSYPNSSSDDDVDGQYCKINKVYPDGEQIATFDNLEDNNGNEDMSTEIIDGVKSFKVTFMRYGDYTSGDPEGPFDLYDMSSSDQKKVYQSLAGTAELRVPDAVRIELELYDQDTVRMVHAGVGEPGENASQKFVRIISIDRGQRKMATVGED